ncbi:MAG: pilin [Spirochaetaceae bacterium]|nr:pilin [Spirochaetaceae bacterium]
MRKTNGFSLIELMVALGVLTIIATVAVPKVQVWNARNRGLQAVVEILSDFSKARSIAGYTVVGDETNGKIEIPVDVDNASAGTMPVYIGVRLQTAMVFRAHEYAIYQKDTMTVDDWADAKVLKKNRLPESVFIVYINKTQFNYSSISPSAAANDVSKRLVFASNGLVKQQYSNSNSSLSERPAEGDSISCGGKPTPMNNLVFTAIVKSKIAASGDSVWYKLDIDRAGEYFICMAFGTDSYSDTIFTSSGNPLSI